MQQHRRWKRRRRRQRRWMVLSLLAAASAAQVVVAVAAACRRGFKSARSSSTTAALTRTTATATATAAANHRASRCSLQQRSASRGTLLSSSSWCGSSQPQQIGTIVADASSSSSISGSSLRAAFLPQRSPSAGVHRRCLLRSRGHHRRARAGGASLGAYVSCYGGAGGGGIGGGGGILVGHGGGGGGSIATAEGRRQGGRRGGIGTFPRRSVPTMMPEGPEVRTLVDQLQPAVGLRLVDVNFVSGRYVRHGRPKGFDPFRNTVTPYRRQLQRQKLGKKGEEEEDAKEPLKVDVVTEWNCKGKFIYLTLDDGDHRRRTGKGANATDSSDDDDGDGNNDYLRSIWITLGMTGRFVSEANEAIAADDNNNNDPPRWYLEFLDVSSSSSLPAAAAADDAIAATKTTTTTTATTKIYYHDKRNFGTLRFSLSRSELERKLKSLGPDMLDGATAEEDFLSVVARQRPTRNVCKFLMDQSKISGVGNYILSESLYRANIDPFASVSELTDTDQRNLYREITSIMRESYDAQGMTRSNGGSYRTVDGQRGRFEFELRCYGRDYCPDGRPVLRESNGPHGRAIWYVEDQLIVPRHMRGDDGRIREAVDDDDEGDVPYEMADEGYEDEVDKDDGKDLFLDGVGTAGEKSLADGLTDPSWRDALGDVLASDRFQSLSDFVASERSESNRRVPIYPPEEDVFAAMNLCSLDDVRVVIVGQDPYHGSGQGHGLAFSVRRGIPPPPSLRNIFREAMDDVGIDPPRHGCLECWARQGVLLLNTVLTVQAGRANSHKGRGWEDFTDRVIEAVNDRRGGVVFLLWGGPAAKKAAGVDEDRHVVVRTSHPSPLGATKTASPFLGSRCFSRTNAALVDAGKDPIDWNVR